MFPSFSVCSSAQQYFSIGAIRSLHKRDGMYIALCLQRLREKTQVDLLNVYTRNVIFNEAAIVGC